MTRTHRAALLATAALALLTTAVPARAAVYELASEYLAVSFKDGSKDLVLFTHLPDSDIFLQMKNYFTDVSSKTPKVELYVPLVELSKADAAAPAPEQGSAKSLVLTSRPTPYKMLIRFDTIHRHHVIQRPPDFITRDSTTTATILSVFGVKTDHPENFLVMVQPEQPAGPPPGLSDIELAAIKSMEDSERAAAAAACGGGPDVPAAASCWRQKVGQLLDHHEAEAPNQPLTPFEQRYIQNRLSRKGYEQFQSLRSSAGNGDRLSLAGNWHEEILNQDIAANAAAAAKSAAPPAPPSVAPIAPAVVAATTSVAASAPAVPHAAPAAPKAKKHASKTAVAAAPVPAATPASASPAPAAAPASARWETILFLLLALAAAAVFLARR